MASILHCRRNQRASASSSHRPRYTATVARLRRRARASPSSSCSQSHLHLGSSSSSSRISHRSRKNQSSSLSNTPSPLLSTTPSYLEEEDDQRQRHWFRRRDYLRNHSGHVERRSESGEKRVSPRTHQNAEDDGNTWAHFRSYWRCLHWC
ncbi:unnamed protein product [Brassica napus]|uniref:(rape) hypothetical protein n=1 Tax=Brassica napus TaxID=3708 RepID=A0A816JBL5_BRANA|nr:unnamed protein product [Brassica napus]